MGMEQMAEKQEQDNMEDRAGWRGEVPFECNVIAVMYDHIEAEIFNSLMTKSCFMEENMGWSNWKDAFWVMCD